MTEEQWAKVEELFDALNALPAPEQQQGLAAIDELEVRNEVASLLEHSGSPTQLHEVIGAAAAQAGAGHAAEDPFASIPKRVGPYRITGFIGRGGMGAVFKAVRDDQTFDKQVAIKVLNIAADTPNARERFRQERQILAGLEHPNIAHLLDGGETEDGVSYIVLEYIDGEDIIEHCNRRGLNNDARLRLFLQVCAAVQFAHQNLVIHRDLKPGNILVTKDGIPKLLDFGIAKLIDPDAERTATNLVALTPNYASPEQVRSAPITTASDVYSLGIILYQLLTGRMPYKIPTLTPLEIDRVVCETAPAVPNISGDLDNIILMALRKEPLRRYGSAQQLADDIQRAMDNLPVRARPDTFGYRAGKFVRRNRLALAASVFVVLSLAGGLGVAMYQAHLAQQRFQQVRKLANTFLFQFHDAIVDIPGTTKARELVVKTALEYLDNLYKSAGNDAELQAELAKAYDRVAEVQGSARGASLGNTAAALSSYQRAIGLYGQLAQHDVKYQESAADCLKRITHVYLNQQRFGDAKASLDRAFVWAERFRAARPLEAAALMGGLYQTSAEYEESHGTVEKAVEQSRNSVHYVEEAVKALPPSDKIKGLIQLTSAHTHLGVALFGQGDLQGAAPLFEAALADTDRWMKLEPLSARMRRNRTAALLNLSELYGSALVPSFEQYAKAVGYSRAAEDCIGPLVEADHNAFYPKIYRTAAVASLAHASFKLQQGSGGQEARDAAAMWHELLASGKLVGSAKSQVMGQIRTLLPIIRSSDGHAESWKIAQEVIQNRRALLAGLPTDDDQYWSLVGDLVTGSEEARAAGHKEEADRLLAEALKLSQPIFGPTAERLYTRYSAANLYAALEQASATEGKCAEAADWHRKQQELWPPLAQKYPYAAMRLQRLETSAPVCK